MRCEISSKQIRQLLMPILLEQILVVAVGMADMIMVAGCGEKAVSGVSLVNTIGLLIIFVFNTLAAGGGIVVSKAIGANKSKEDLKNLANHLVLLCTVLSCLVMLGCLVFHQQILNVLFGKAEKEVLMFADIYFLITAVSYPFISAFYGCSAIFRCSGKAYKSMILSVTMNILNVSLNACLIYGLGKGVAGAAIATLIGRMVAATGGLLILSDKNESIRVWIPDIHLKKEIFEKLIAYSIPNCVDNGSIQIGTIITNSMISGLGTASIAANSIASTMTSFACIPGTATMLSLNIIAGKCFGAGDVTSAKSNTKRVLRYAYVLLLVFCMAILVVVNPVVRVYGISEQGSRLAKIIICFYCASCPFFWPTAYVLPSFLRAAGENRFVMTVSMISTCFVRVGLSFICIEFLKPYGIGLYGVWIATFVEWIVRSTVYLIHIKKKKYD